MTLQSAVAESGGYENKERSSRLSESAVAELKEQYPAFSVSVWKDKDEVWSYQFGFEDVGQKIPVTADTKFNIYSTSKAITGMAYAALEAKHVLSIEEKIGDLDAGMPGTFSNIRLQDLLSHASGIRHYQGPTDWVSFSNQRCDSAEDAVAYFSDDPLVFNPGEKESYSTFGFVLLSAVLEKKFPGSDFIDIVNHSLGSWATYELDSDDAVKAQPFFLAGQSPVKIDGLSPSTKIPLPVLSAECKFGGGGIIASSKQLARLGVAIYTNDLFPRSKRGEKFAPYISTSGKPVNIAYGFAVSELQHSISNEISLSLSGGAPGGRSYLLVLLDSRVSVAITGNFDGENLGRMSKEIAEIWSIKNMTIE